MNRIFSPTVTGGDLQGGIDMQTIRSWRPANKRWLAISMVGLAVFAATDRAVADPTAEVWVTTESLSKKLSSEPALPFYSSAASDNAAANTAIRVDPDKTYQTMLGLGASLEHSTCYNLSRLDPSQRAETIARLVDSEDGIGMNLMRICIGTPDFTGDSWYSYDDLPEGRQDPELIHFSIEKDSRYVLPILKAALAANPQLLFFASPWSPPGWMKSTGSMIGGHLLPEHYASYAQYFVRFLEEYQREGVPIYAVTVQNEPGVDRQRDEPKWHYPSCRWTGEQERDFIRDHLGPALRKSGLKTKIWCYDHNYNVAPTPDGDDPGIAYPRAILSDPRAAEFVSGVAFHGYAGKPEGMKLFLQEFPNRPVYFTEGSVFGLSGSARLIELLSSGASSYNAWVTMIDNEGKPNNGPFRASRTCIVLDTKRLTVDYPLDYFLYGQFMRFIERGATRIDASSPDTKTPAIAFLNPDRKVVLIAANLHRERRLVAIETLGMNASLTLPPRAVATLVWASE